MSNRTKRKFERRSIVIAVLVVAAAVLAFMQYGEHIRNRDRVLVEFVSAEGKRSPVFKLEKAVTEAQRQKGLMYVKSGELDSDAGMFFGFPEQKQQVFWMKNTYIPLDMIFLDSQYTIVGAVENTTPLSEKRYSVEAPSQFVIELPGGTVKKFGISTRSKLQFVGNEFNKSEVR